MKQLVQFNEILGNKKIIKIISLFLDNPSLEINQNEIIKKTKIAKATAVKWLRRLFENEFLNIKKIGTTNLYSLNNNNPKIKQIKTLFIIWLLDSFNVENETFLYGSCARGENIKDSDIDLLIIGNKKRNEVIDYIEKISKKIGKSINILIFSELEWSMMAKRDKPFFERVEKDKIMIR